MGEVYRARDLTLGRDVAIKVLPAEALGDAERLERFEREARALASLNHPNVATIHGFDTSGTRHLLVMELVDGGTLADRHRLGIPYRSARPSRSRPRWPTLWRSPTTRASSIAT